MQENAAGNLCFISFLIIFVKASGRFPGFLTSELLAAEKEPDVLWDCLKVSVVKKDVNERENGKQ